MMSDWGHLFFPVSRLNSFPSKDPQSLSQPPKVLATTPFSSLSELSCLRAICTPFAISSCLIHSVAHWNPALVSTTALDWLGKGCCIYLITECNQLPGWAAVLESVRAIWCYWLLLPSHSLPWLQGPHLLWIFLTYISVFRSLLAVTPLSCAFS